MLRALVVDDQPDVRLLVRWVLEATGFAVAEAESGPAALEALSGGALADLVVMDVQMPQMDGWDTLQAIRANPATADLPVLMCTVKARPEDEARGWERGCDGYVAKPFIVTDLAAAAHAVTSRPEPERARVRVAALAHAQDRMR